MHYAEPNRRILQLELEEEQYADELEILRELDGNSNNTTRPNGIDVQSSVYLPCRPILLALTAFDDYTCLTD